LFVLGAAAFMTALVRLSRDRGRPAPVLWFTAGLALVGASALGAASDRVGWDAVAADSNATLRARIVIIDGWTESRWGLRSSIDILRMEFGGRPLHPPRSGRIEVRSAVRTDDLPTPGSVVDILARPAGRFDRALLVVPSVRLLRPSGTTRTLPRFRDRLARELMGAAGTHPTGIRSAELASALALGRRDLVPRAQRERWRRSGFAHLLAVSGLHVGIVGGAVWLISALLGAGPRASRLVALIAIPAYAALAGASPSAVRAALMGVVYLGARFLGRAVVPMAAVLLAALVLLVADPTMIGDPGYQLTVVVTAALIRWVQPVASALRGPRWLAAAVAVPLVAQVAAAPLVAWHFRRLVPGALIANLLALPLLAPTVLTSVLAACLAPFWTYGAACLLSVLHLLISCLESIGGAARGFEVIPPRIPAVAAIALCVTGWLAVHSGRNSRRAAVVWIGFVLTFSLLVVARTPRFDPTVSMLPVGDGAAVVAAAGGDVLLADAGRYPRQAAVLLANTGSRHLRAVMTSHTDEDHIGGAVDVLQTFDVDNLVLPSWMVAAIESVPLLRAARLAGARIVPVARGSALEFNEMRLAVLWPPAHHPPREENERSLVASIDLGPGSVLITSDIGRSTERRIGPSAGIRCAVLVVPHHGSRGGSSEILLDRACPTVALIPAAPGNTHGHPHHEVIDRLTSRGIVVRTSLRDTEAGARWNGKRWLAYP
jgi:competence protein ComEC